MNRTASPADEVSPRPRRVAALRAANHQALVLQVRDRLDQRGPSGVIGTSKQCARESVAALLDDWATGRLPQSDPNLPDVIERLPRATDLRSWKAVDEYELRTGRATLRPRAKLVERGKLLAIAQEDMG